MESKFEEFEEKVRNASVSDLLDSLVIHAKRADDDQDYYEAVKIIKRELLARFEGLSN